MRYGPSNKQPANQRKYDGHLDLLTKHLLKQSLSVPADPRVAALVDVNGDGRLDIVLSHGRSNILSILQNDGYGTFTLRSGPPINVGFPAAEVVAVDVNGDRSYADTNPWRRLIGDDPALAPAVYHDAQNKNANDRQIGA